MNENNRDGFDQNHCQEGACVMTQHLIAFRDTDTAKGVRYETIKRYADQRGSTVDELINIVVADFLGYRSTDEEDGEWERALLHAGIARFRPQLIKRLRRFFTESEIPGSDTSYKQSAINRE